MDGTALVLGGEGPVGGAWTAALGSRDAQRSAQPLGHAALSARTGAESDVLDAIATLLRDAKDWPGRDSLRIAVVDAHTGHVDAYTGHTEAFDADGQFTLLEAVEAVEAVEASCAVPLVRPPVTAAGRRWIDGGSRGTANLHRARGHRRIVAIAPTSAAPGPHPTAQRQAAELAAEGADILLLSPDRTARRAMGRNMTADARRPGAARAGHAQGTALAGKAAAIWHG
ncbi:patatin-like phospholipase family protein [Streptomyces avermitilis]